MVVFARDGIFPASSCLKVSGQYVDGPSLTIRGCGLDSGSLRADTEIVRVSHCGTFFFQDRLCINLSSIF